VQTAYAPWVAVIGRRPAPMDDDDDAHASAGEVFVMDRDGAIAAVLVLQDRPDHLWLDHIALYARAGYAETDRRPEDGFDRVFMAKRLG
jgi:hypothetical protein